MSSHGEINWWYRLVNVALLGAGLLGQPAAFRLAMGLCGMHVCHLAMREMSFMTWSVIARIAYLGLLLTGQWEPMSFVYGIQIIVTTAMVVFGQGPLARAPQAQIPVTVPYTVAALFSETVRECSPLAGRCPQRSRTFRADGL